MPNHDLGRIVNMTSHQIKRYIDKATAESGLTGVQGRILHYILMRSQDGELIFQKDIEETFNLRRSTASGILRLMEQNGMIERKSVPQDARLKSVLPTERASVLRERVTQDIRDMETAMARDISPEDLKICEKVLLQMIKNLESQ